MPIQLPDYSQAKVLVVGDVMLDRYMHGKADRISPEAPVPVLVVQHQEERPGGAANVALNIAALGARVSLVGIVGEDHWADALQLRLNAAGVHCDFIRSAVAPTITKIRGVGRQQQLIRLDFEKPFDDVTPEMVEQQVLHQLDGVQVVILSDYNKGTLRNHKTLIQACRERNIMVLADPKGTDVTKYSGASLITPNFSEFEAIAGTCPNEKAVIGQGESLIESLDMQALLITRSEHGMTLLRRGQLPFHLPTQAREVFDVTGAGDTVISVLGASLAAGMPMEEAVVLANAAAGVVVGKLGTAAITVHELRAAITDESSIGYGAVTDEQLMMAVEAARARGEKVVMTNGCFDIVHAGHVHYLSQARGLGDRLIVAVNSDDSVKRLKGPGRPINPEDRRMSVLAALKAVDWTVKFAEDTPERLIHLIKPDILVKGGDYTVETVVGHEFVQSYGGEVRVLDFIENTSTTSIVNKIIEQHKG
jgi:D-beta-D-heptose 7-phosphate kinase/D-beta-D-heptose 1-phosphate adenosyltransferase